MRAKEFLKEGTIDWNKRAKELFAKGMNEQQVRAQLLKEGCPPRQVDVYVQAGQMEESNGTTPGVWDKIKSAFQGANPVNPNIKYGDTAYPSKQQSDQKPVKESATAGATSAANIGTVVNPHISPGKARGKKSYTGRPGKSGTKSPAQPKIVQRTNKNGTAKGAHELKGVSLFGGPALKR